MRRVLAAAAALLCAAVPMPGAAIRQTDRLSFRFHRRRTDPCADLRVP